jgi:hypothetical protein
MLDEDKYASDMKPLESKRGDRTEPDYTLQVKWDYANDKCTYIILLESTSVTSFGFHWGA